MNAPCFPALPPAPPWIHYPAPLHWIRPEKEPCRWFNHIWQPYWQALPITGKIDYIRTWETPDTSFFNLLAWVVEGVRFGPDYRCKARHGISAWLSHRGQEKSSLHELANNPLPMPMQPQDCYAVPPPWVKFAADFNAPGWLGWWQTKDPWLNKIWFPFWQTLSASERAHYLSRWQRNEEWENFLAEAAREGVLAPQQEWLQNTAWLALCRRALLGEFIPEQTLIKNRTRAEQENPPPWIRYPNPADWADWKEARATHWFWNDWLLFWQPLSLAEQQSYIRYWHIPGSSFFELLTWIIDAAERVQRIQTARKTVPGFINRLRDASYQWQGIADPLIPPPLPQPIQPRAEKNLPPPWVRQHTLPPHSPHWWHPEDFWQHRVWFPFWQMLDKTERLHYLNFWPPNPAWHTFLHEAEKAGILVPGQAWRPDKTWEAFITRFHLQPE